MRQYRVDNRGLFSRTIGKRPQECCSSSILIKPPGEPHANHYGQAGAHCLIIEVKSPRLELVRDTSRLFESPDHIRGGIISALAMRTYREFCRMDCASHLIILGLILEMIGHAERRSLNESPSTPPHWLSEARDFIRAHFAQHVSLFNVAGFAGVHPSHLARMFRKHYQCTIGDYVRHLRLEFAKQELAAGKRSLAEIGLAAGFYDQSHFSQSFKHGLGITPREFRDANRLSKGDTRKLQSSNTSNPESC